MTHHLTRLPPLPPGLLINRDASLCVPPRAALRFVTSPLPVSFCGCQISQLCTHKHTHMRVHARTDPDAVHSTRNEDKRLEFPVWHQTLSSRWPATPSFSGSSFHSSLSLRSVLFLEPKTKCLKTLEENLPLFSSSWETKTNLMEKLMFFYFFLLFFSNSRHNVYQYSNLSDCVHSQVQCANVASRKLLDCLLVRHSLQLTSLLSVL